MRNSVFILIGIILFLVGMSACTEERKVDVASKINPKNMPMMTTKNVATYISDSGIVQYKIVAPLWKVYEEVDTPYWSFPEGLYLQKYDRDFKVIATVAADSAIFYSKLKIWRLDGHVEMTKAPKDLFQTAQLFWDQNGRKLYSDSFIHIETETHVLEGHGFQSDDRLTSYRVIKPQGIFPINSAEFSQGGAPVGSAGASEMPAHSGPQPVGPLEPVADPGENPDPYED